MREVVRGQLSRAGDSGGTVGMDAETSLGVSLNQDSRNLNRTIAGLSAADLKRAVETLNQARHVYVAGASLTFPLAKYCALALSDSRRGIFLVAEEELGAYPVAQITSEDCVLAFTLPPDAGPTNRFLARVKQSNNPPLIAVTDAPLSEIGAIGDVILLAATAGTELLSSLVAPMAIAHALVDGFSTLQGAPTNALTK
jgi:DNA-binding MurR/RpiR family transcriptional regulator